MSASGRAAQSGGTGFPGHRSDLGSAVGRAGREDWWQNRLPARAASRSPKIANGLIDPILARRAGINTLLLGSWDEIAGEQFAGCSRPERIRWPRQEGPDETGGGFAPGVLTVACEGARALFLMHQEAELISRVNSFFGFQAISQVRIVQKAIHLPTRSQRRGRWIRRKRPVLPRCLARSRTPGCARRWSGLAPVSSGAPRSNGGDTRARARATDHACVNMLHLFGHISRYRTWINTGTPPQWAWCRASAGFPDCLAGVDCHDFQRMGDLHDPTDVPTDRCRHRFAACPDPCRLLGLLGSDTAGLRRHAETGAPWTRPPRRRFRREVTASTAAGG
jgi:hypothetical protein